MKIDKILKFRLTGKYAHFRKFYTTSSSLSYSLPTRTVVSGLLASILKISRNEYYELFSENNSRIAIKKNNATKKKMFSMNYLHCDFVKKYLINGKNNKIRSVHSQCKLELLMPDHSNFLDFTIYLFLANNEKFNEIISKIKNNNLGYGIYLGQRQFRANVNYIDLINKNEIEFCDECKFIDTAITKEHVKIIDFSDKLKITEEHMPIYFGKTIQNKKKNSCREILIAQKIVYEETGKRLTGKFINCHKIHEDYVYFM